jgi:hypothetical protein
MVKCHYKKWGFLDNRDGFNAQTYCCDKENLSDRGGKNCRKSLTGMCATAGLNAKMRCFDKYPAEGSTIYENTNPDCEFVTGSASKGVKTLGVVGTGLARSFNLSSKSKYFGGKRRKSTKKRSTKRRKTAKNLDVNKKRM